MLGKQGMRSNIEQGFRVGLFVTINLPGVEGGGPEHLKGTDTQAQDVVDKSPAALGSRANGE